MAKVIHKQIKNDTESNKKFPKEHGLQFFNEEKYIKDRKNDFTPDRIQLLREMPAEEHVFEFIYAIFTIADCS